MPDDLLIPREVKTILRVSLATVYRLAETEQIPSVRFSISGKDNKALRFKKSDVIKFVEDSYNG